MDVHTLERLEYPKVLARIAAHAVLAQGAEAARTLVPTDDTEVIRTRAERIAEGTALLEAGHDFGLERFEDPENLFDRAAIEGAALLPSELQTVAAVLRNARDLQKVLRLYREAAPRLMKLAADLAPEPDLLATLEKAILPDGTVADDASPELRRLRVAIAAVQTRIRERLERMAQNADLKTLLTGDYVTQRGGRYVLPVAAAQAAQVPGIVHDRSDTGVTVFIEPQALVTLGNELRSLAADEEREVQRILRELTARVRGHLDPLRLTAATLVTFDLVRAAARYGRAHRMRPAAVATDGVLRIVNGRHPILEDALTESGSRVVPLNFEIGGPVRAVAITGANAGGKTVSLKTIGLLTLLARTGLPVPADEGTAFPSLAHVLVDIGDEQSIEANLSTFSGHVRRVKEILGAADARTLVLLDEIGAGTDPIEGGPLACGILEALHARGSLCIVTTHLGQVKGFVHEHAGMENASVEFDPQTLRPTYRLIVGQPGASHALAIARRFGLPDDVLRTAEGLVDSRAIEMEGLLARLTTALRAAEADAAAARRQRGEAEEARQELARRLEDLKRDRKEALRRAAEEARGLVENTRRQLDEALREARAAGADTNATRHIRRRVEEQRDRIKKRAAELAPKTRQAIPLEALDEGRRVWIETMRRHGTVSRIDPKHRTVTVDAGGLTLEVEASAVREADPDDASSSSAPTAPKVIARTAAVGPELDLRGHRADEARRRLETYLNEAALAGLASVRVIHGFGTDAVRKAVHDLVHDYPLVAGFRYGESGEGGRGVTVITFK